MLESYCRTLDFILTIIILMLVIYRYILDIYTT